MSDVLATAQAALDGAFFNDRMWKTLVRDLVAEIKESDQSPKWVRDVPAHRRIGLALQCAEALALLGDIQSEVWINDLDDAMTVVKNLLEGVLKAI